MSNGKNIVGHPINLLTDHYKYEAFLYHSFYQMMTITKLSSFVKTSDIKPANSNLSKLLNDCYKYSQVMVEH